MKTSNLVKYLLEVFSKVFSLLFHVLDKIKSSWVPMSVLGGIIFDSIVNKGDLLRISNGHFQK